MTIPPGARKRPGPEPSPWAQAGLALMIPTIMLAGPLAGWLIAWGLQRWLGWGEWTLWVMLPLGFIAGIRETIKVIRRITQSSGGS